MYITTYVTIYIQGNYINNIHQLRETTKIYNKIQSQNKINYKKQNQNNTLELKYKFLKDGMVAASDTFNSKLFHNTAL